MNDAGRFAALALERGRAPLRPRRDDGRGAERRFAHPLRRPVGRADRAVGRGQVDAPASRGPARAAERRRGRGRRRADLDHERRSAHGAKAQPDRLRLPVPSSPAGILGAGKSRPAADDRRPAARRGGEAGARTPRLSRPRQARDATGRPSFRAASSSASPSRARSPTARASCSPTNRPATSTRRRRATCSTRWRRS